MASNNEEVVIPSPEVLQNLDIIDLINRCDRFILETARNASATRTETNPHDARRRHEITDRFERRFQMYAAEPELDLPKYHPRPLKCPVPPDVNKVENNDSMQLVNMLVALRTELSYSDSAERASGFKAADSIRIQTVVDKIKIINDAVTNDPEIDTPDVDLQEPPVNPNNP
jgi:hypothetical protein